MFDSAISIEKGSVIDITYHVFVDTMTERVNILVQKSWAKIFIVKYEDIWYVIITMLY